MTSRPYGRRGAAYCASFSLDAASGEFGVKFPDLPGCIASGGDFVHARDQAKHVLDAWIDALIDRGEEIPTPTLRTQARPTTLMVWIAARSAFERERLSPARRPL